MSEPRRSLGYSQQSYDAQFVIPDDPAITPNRSRDRHQLVPVPEEPGT